MSENVYATDTGTGAGAGGAVAGAHKRAHRHTRHRNGAAGGPAPFRCLVKPLPGLTAPPAAPVIRQ